ncbi:hypothetical protein H5410_021331 [Solanum commersonii]|uniref:Uncharacterized protein n=1 Tax=Solanum commersonii TaxID=4109 RepID=A0A9J5ZBN3_SOLCO|nr:hypothetical protein H5410_021331 [Solanum commersonii]
MGPDSRTTPQLGDRCSFGRVRKPKLDGYAVTPHSPVMQKSIAESEARVERRMEDMMDQEGPAANNR